MTIKELVKELKGFNQNAEVRFSSDEEGNCLHAVADIVITKGLYEDDESKTAVVIYPLHTDADIV